MLFFYPFRIIIQKLLPIHLSSCSGKRIRHLIMVAQSNCKSVGRIKNVMDTPAAFLFFAMVALWLMLRILKIDPWLSIAPALA